MKNYKLQISNYKILILLFMICNLSFITPLYSPVYAHILLTDGSIGAVVHVNPEDDPIIGQPASFFFEFKDKENRFNPLVCDCTYSLEKDGQVLASGSLFEESETPSLDNASFSYTFSEKGVYSVILTGSPKTANAFQSFKLEDSIRVEREDPNKESGSSSPNWISSHIVHLVVFGFGAIIALIIFFSGRRKQS